MLKRGLLASPERSPSHRVCDGRVDERGETGVERGKMSRRIVTGEGRAFANIPESALTDTVSLAFKVAIVFRQILEDLRPVSGYRSRAPCESFKPWPCRNLIKPTPSEKEFRRYSRPKNYIASSRRGLSFRDSLLGASGTTDGRETL